MLGIGKQSVWKFATRSLAGTCVVGILTFAGHSLDLTALSASCLYLVAVTLLSLTGDFPAAVVVSIVSFLCLDYFFFEPLYTLRVGSAMDTVALLASLMTALVITSLVSKVRRESNSAQTQRKRIERLYRLAQQLLAFEPTTAGEVDFLEPFLGVFGMTAVSVFEAATAELRTAGISRAGLPGKTRDAYILSADQDDEKTGVSVRRLQSCGKFVGAVGFEGLEEPAFTAGPLTALAVTLLDRGRALRKAAEAAAAAQVEIYRSAVLDALAHEFKTPLATILAAAGAIQEAGPLSPAQAEMADTVESESTRLANLTSRLLRTARLDNQEIKPRIELTELPPLIRQVIAQYVNRDRSIVFNEAGSPYEALADPELLRLTLTQLVENACKYSRPGSQVIVSAEPEGDLVAVRVSNDGSSIPEEEQDRIFERFYRGAGAVETSSGTGLGLYVARKIAVAHGGTLELESASETVTFRLRLLGVKSELNDAVTA